MALAETAMGAMLKGYQFGEQHKDRKEARADRETQRGRESELHEWRRERFSRERETHQRKTELAAGKRAMAPLIHAIERGDRIDPDTLKRADQDTGGRLSKAYSTVRTKEQREAARTLERLADPEAPEDLKDPKVIDAANKVLRAELREGVGEAVERDGKRYRITNKKIAGIVPNPSGDGVMLDLRVSARDSEGNEVTWGAPATDGRDTRPDALVADIPLDAAMEKIQGVNGMARLVENNKQLRDAFEQVAVSYGVELGDEDGYDIKEVKQGDEIVTYAVTDEGKMTEIARASRWKDKDKGPGSRTGLYARADSMLKTMFADEMRDGMAIITDQTSRDDFLEASKRSHRAIDAGLNPGEAVSKAYRELVPFEIPPVDRDRIEQRIDAQLEDMKERAGGEDSGYASANFLGMDFYETYNGWDEDAARAELRAVYEAHYNRTGALPEDYLRLPSAQSEGGGGLKGAAARQRQGPSPRGDSRQSPGGEPAPPARREGEGNAGSGLQGRADQGAAPGESRQSGRGGNVDAVRRSYYDKLRAGGAARYTDTERQVALGDARSTVAKLKAARDAGRIDAEVYREKVRMLRGMLQSMGIEMPAG